MKFESFGQLVKIYDKNILLNKTVDTEMTNSFQFSFAKFRIIRKFFVFYKSHKELASVMNCKSVTLDILCLIVRLMYC